jgi:hypothetical protein
MLAIALSVNGGYIMTGRACRTATVVIALWVGVGGSALAASSTLTCTDDKGKNTTYTVTGDNCRSGTTGMGDKYATCTSGDGGSATAECGAGCINSGSSTCSTARNAMLPPGGASIRGNKPSIKGATSAGAAHLSGGQQSKTGLTAPTTTTAPSALSNPSLLGGAGAAGATTSNRIKSPTTSTGLTSPTMPTR